LLQNVGMIFDYFCCENLKKIVNSAFIKDYSSQYCNALYKNMYTINKLYKQLECLLFFFSDDENM